MKILTAKTYEITYTISTKNRFRNNLVYTHKTYDSFKESDIKKALANDWNLSEDNITINKVIEI